VLLLLLLLLMLLPWRGLPVPLASCSAPKL
jgi:hypothetical protein